MKTTKGTERTSTMNRLLILSVLFLTLLVGNPAVSADFQKGLDAHDRGDYATALREWKPFAEQGDADAQYNLGAMYDNGHGVLQDFVRAHMWFNIAASSGKGKNASINRDIVAKRMNSNQIETAQRLDRECVKNNYKGC